MYSGWDAQRTGLTAGLEVAGSGDRYVMNHIKRSLPASGFARVHNRSRVNRFFRGLPQLEELPDCERLKLRCIFGEGVCLELATWLTDLNPQFCITLADPVTLFLERHEESLAQTGGLSIQELIDAEEISNPISRAIAAQLGDIEFQDDRPDIDIVVHLLKMSQFVFLSDHINLQATALFKAMGLPHLGEEAYKVSDWYEHGISEQQIEFLLERHDVDLALFETVLIAYEEQGGALSNPLGFDADLLTYEIGVMDKAMPDLATILNRSYRDLLVEVQLEHQVEALLLLLKHGSIDYLSEPQLLSDLVAEADFETSIREAPNAGSKFNAAVLALHKLNLPEIAIGYADAALDLDPSFGPARRLAARAKAAA